MSETPKRERKIKTTYEGPQCTGFLSGWHGADWTATYEDYDLGDPVGVGSTEVAAIADLQMEQDLHDS